MISNDQLNSFIGEWEGDEKLSSTAWTAAGTARGTLTVAAGAGGGLLLDYAEERDGARMTGHGVVCGDGWWWFDSFGFIPTEPGVAEWRAGELVLERTSDRGRTVTTLRIRDDLLEHRIDTAVPADAPLVPLLRGTYARRGS